MTDAERLDWLDKILKGHGVQIAAQGGGEAKA